MTNVIPIRRPSLARLECSTCGATADAACNCGAPYIPAGTRAAEAVAANPEKSNRVIAAEVGVSEPTVRRARKSTASPDAVAKRIGKDGKARKLPTIESKFPISTGAETDKAYMHLFMDGTCHELPPDKNYHSPEWIKWRQDHPGQWFWRPLRSTVYDADGKFIGESIADANNKYIRPGPWFNPDGTKRRDIDGAKLPPPKGKITAAQIRYAAAHSALDLEDVRYAKVRSEFAKCILRLYDLKKAYPVELFAYCGGNIVLDDATEFLAAVMKHNKDHIHDKEPGE